MIEKFKRMNIKQKALVIGAAALFFTLAAMAAGKFVSWFAAQGRSGPSWENEGQCVASALLDVNDGYAQIGLDHLLMCSPGDRRVAEQHGALKQMDDARDSFAAIFTDWRPGLETLFGKEPGANPEATDTRILQIDQFLKKHPQGYYAQLATYAKALAYYDSGYAGQAMKVLDQGGDMTAVEGYAALLYAMAALRMGEYDLVGRKAGEFKARHPGTRFASEMILISAQAVSKQGRAEDALAICRQAARDADAPAVSRGRAYAAMARIYSNLGRPHMAGQALIQIALARPAPDLDLDFGALVSEYAGGALPPDTTDADRMAVGRFLMDKEQYASVAALLSKGLPSGADARVFLILGDASYRLGRYSDAIGYLQSAGRNARDDDTRSRACGLRGMALRRRNNRGGSDLTAAKKELEACAKTYSVNRGLLFQALADLYDSMDSPVSAVGALENLAKDDPGQSEDHLLRLARHYLLKGDGTAAFGVYDALVKNFPEGQYADDASFWAARIQMTRGRAADSSARFIALRENYPYSYFANRATDYLKQLGVDAGPDWRAMAPPAFPRLRSEALRYGYAFMDLGYTGLADKEFSLALVQGGEIGDAAGVGAARLLRRQGKMIPSVKAIERRVRISPRFHNLVMSHPAYRELLFPTLYRDQVKQSATRESVSPALAFAIIRQESRFEARATSHSNAKGLMQIIPSTGKWIAQKRGISGFSVDQLYEIGVNVDFGCWYIREMLKKFNGDQYLAVAAYNGGPGNVGKWKKQYDTSDADLFAESIPRTETRDYVTKVMHNWYVYDYLLNNP